MWPNTAYVMPTPMFVSQPTTMPTPLSAFGAPQSAVSSVPSVAPRQRMQVPGIRAYSGSVGPSTPAASTTPVLTCSVPVAVQPAGGAPTVPPLRLGSMFTPIQPGTSQPTTPRSPKKPTSPYLTAYAPLHGPAPSDQTAARVSMGIASLVVTPASSAPNTPRILSLASGQPHRAGSPKMSLGPVSSVSAPASTSVTPRQTVTLFPQFTPRGTASAYGASTPTAVNAASFYTSSPIKGDRIAPATAPPPPPQPSLTPAVSQPAPPSPRVTMGQNTYTLLSTLPPNVAPSAPAFASPVRQYVQVISQTPQQVYLPQNLPTLVPIAGVTTSTAPASSAIPVTSSQPMAPTTPLRMTPIRLATVSPAPHYVTASHPGTPRQLFSTTSAPAPAPAPAVTAQAPTQVLSHSMVYQQQPPVSSAPATPRQPHYVAHIPSQPTTPRQTTMSAPQPVPLPMTPQPILYGQQFTPVRATAAAGAPQPVTFTQLPTTIGTPNFNVPAGGAVPVLVPSVTHQPVYHISQPGTPAASVTHSAIMTFPTTSPAATATRATPVPGTPSITTTAPVAAPPVSPGGRSTPGVYTDFVFKSPGLQAKLSGAEPLTVPTVPTTLLSPKKYRIRVVSKDPKIRAEVQAAVNKALVETTGKLHMTKEDLNQAVLYHVSSIVRDSTLASLANN